MKTADYHIYVITEHFDKDLDASVQRWALCGKSISRRIALYKARRRALCDGYSKIEVVRRAYLGNGQLSQSKVIWQHSEDQSSFALRLAHKARFWRLKKYVK
mgnify:CR=1 FL=1|jgi:hypothetical protein|tara:strand:- start:151 stop:456 length:306 start_codon:yes stop_codon:yes gene_type:complete